MEKLYQRSMFICAALSSALLLLSSTYLHAETYTVTTTTDSGPGSLRDAINTINLSTDPTNTINFLIPAGGPGYDPTTNTWTIVPQSDLANIIKQVTIDGYTQPGSKPATINSTAILTIILNGNNYLTGNGQTTGNGLHFLPGSDGSVVQGLVINQWLGNGILVDSGDTSLSNVSIVGCFIGTDASGTREMANRTGIGISGLIGTCFNTTIGTAAPADRNVIAGSFSSQFSDVYGSTGACIKSFFNEKTTITNNSIGTDKTGTYALGNSSVGIYLRGEQNGTLTNNLVSGHSIFGIRLRGTRNGVVQGNFIGTDITGTQPLGNANAGIELEDKDFGVGNCIIANLISGNGTGIHLGSADLPGTILNTIQGNKIGTDATGTKVLPNQRYGIVVSDSQNTIGGSEPSQANVISGNLGGGILLYGMVNTTANIVGNNLIGTDLTGIQPLPNKGNGIQVGLNGAFGGTFGNTIGSSALLSTKSICTLDNVEQHTYTREFKKQNLSEFEREPRQRQNSTNTPNRGKSHLHTGPVFSMPQIANNTKKLLSQSAQTIGLNFTASTVSDVLSPVPTPPQPNGWVGPQQYIVMSFGIIRSFDKSTGLPDGVLDIDASNFFGIISSEAVQVHYSRFLDRWLFSCLNSSVSELIVIWSDSGVITPETVYTRTIFTNAELVPQNNSAKPAILQFPQLATDVNAVYNSLDSFDATTGNFLGESVVIMPNSSIITGNSSPAFNVLSGIFAGPDPLNFGDGISATENFDQDAQFGYLIHASLFGYPCSLGQSTCTYNQLFFYRILNPGSASPSLGQEIILDVPSYADPANAPHKGNLYTQILNPTVPPTNAMYLETFFTLIHAPHVRNKQLYACHNIQVDNTGKGTPEGDRVGVRWYQFDLTGDPTGNGCGIETETTCPVLVQWGTLFDSAAENPKFYYIPAIMTNKNGDLIIEGTVSGNNDFTNVFFAGRKAADPLGTLRDPVLVTNNTNNPYNYGPATEIGQRWGNNSSLAPDPSNDLIIWSTGEWAAIENGWGIQATQLLPAQ